MIVLAREVFLCKCSTQTPSCPEGDGLEREVRFVHGAEEHMRLLESGAP